MSTNPFDDDEYTPSRRRRPPTISPPKQDKQPIFSARGVEWPLPLSFDAGTYRKYRRASKSLGNALGIVGCGLKLPEVDLAESAGEGGTSGSGAGYGGLSGLMGRVLGGASSGVVGVGLSSEFSSCCLFDLLGIIWFLSSTMMHPVCACVVDDVKDMNKLTLGKIDCTIIVLYRMRLIYNK